MPTIGKLKQAVAYDKNLSKNYDFEPNMSIPKSNPYYTFALNQKLMAANSQTTSQTAKDLILKPNPPKNARTDPMTPKIKFVKNAGSRTNKRRTSKRRTIKNKRKRNNKSNRK